LPVDRYQIAQFLPQSFDQLRMSVAVCLAAAAQMLGELSGVQEIRDDHLIGHGGIAIDASARRGGNGPQEHPGL